MFRRRRADEETKIAQFVNLDAEVDWATIPRRLRSYVDEALESLDRWRRLVARQPEGPLRERLDGWTRRLDGAVHQLVGTAVRVGEIEQILSALDPERAAEEYKAAKRKESEGTVPPEMAALEARFLSVQRMMNAVGDAEERLRVLDARIGAVVAQGAELTVVGNDEAAERMDTDLDGLVGDLESLRAALGELG
ncbi:MAG: hypothetical protein KDB02_00970 [Acidimicrobiales bacterium]|nr:hypothetical protein [Acidimicrobiales bacterium]